jgi:hypothetical protein
MGPQDVALVEGVPVDEQGSETDLVVTPEANNTVSLSPFPFRRDPLEFGILARSIPKGRYADDSELQRTLTSTPYSLIKYTLRSAGTHANSFSAQA